VHKVSIFEFLWGLGQNNKLPRRLQLWERVTFYLALSVFKHRFLAVHHSPATRTTIGCALIWHSSDHRLDSGPSHSVVGWLVLQLQSSAYVVSFHLDIWSMSMMSLLKAPLLPRARLAVIYAAVRLEWSLIRVPHVVTIEQCDWSVVSYFFGVFLFVYQHYVSLLHWAREASGFIAFVKRFFQWCCYYIFVYFNFVEFCWQPIGSWALVVP